MFPLLERNKEYSIRNQSVESQVKTDNILPVTDLPSKANSKFEDNLKTYIPRKDTDAPQIETKPFSLAKISLKVRFSLSDSIYPQALVVHCSGEILKSNCLLFHRIFNTCINNQQIFIIIDMQDVVHVDRSVWEFFSSMTSKILKFQGVVLFSGIKKEHFSDATLPKIDICNCASIDICLKVFLYLVNETEKRIALKIQSNEIITLLNNLKYPEIAAFINSKNTQSGNCENSVPDNYSNLSTCSSADRKEIYSLFHSDSAISDNMKSSIKLKNPTIFPKIAAIERKDAVRINSNDFGYNSHKNSVQDCKTYTVQEKIYTIISQHGPCSFARIKKYLYSKEFGSEKISTIGLYNLLRTLNLESLSKRIRYYRSC